VRAQEPAARTPVVVQRADAARPPAAAVGDPRDLLDVDVKELAGPRARAPRCPGA
jgi:hypothetical protein